MRKIVIATDSFKGCMSGLDVAKHIEKGFKREFNDCNIIKVAMADGGEGTVNSLVSSTQGRLEEVVAYDPLGRQINSFIGFDKENQVAFIEMAAASGLELLTSEELNPLKTNTYGTGQLIKKALDKGVNHIIIGIGGSATNDCGIGMANALGVKFLDSLKQEVEPIAKNLDKIVTIDLSGLDKRLLNTKIEVACDVENRLYGSTGASKVFAKQKGADSKMIDVLEEKVKHFSNVLEKTYSKDPQELIGGGAAGGLGVALNFFCNGQLRSGVEIVSDFLELNELIKGSDLVITGEGRIDSQSLNGKAPIGVAKIASNHNVDCVAICGSVDPSAEEVYNHGIKAVFSIMQAPQSLEKAFESTAENLELTARAVARLYDKKNSNFS